MTKNLNQILLKIEDALQSNTECRGNLLLPNRIFFREENGKSEVLVSLNNKMQRPHYWGHVFWHEELYIALIIAMDYWFNPSSKEQLFKEFWQNLREDGKWFPIGGDVFDIKEEFAQGCESLSRMISKFDMDHTQSDIDYLDADTYQQAILNLIEMIKEYKIAMWEAKSYAIFDLYGSDPIIAGSNNTRF